MISIIIATYNAPQFLKECIQSIYAQTYKDYEVILGIDGCKKTLSHILENKKFYKKCKVFNFEQNNGLFITKNNLLKESSYENILFFDSDDIMKKDMLQLCCDQLNHYNLLRTKFKDFNNPDGDKIEHAQGAIAIKRHILNILVGWESWKCNADVEFLQRASYYGIEAKLMDEITFSRRIHENNLTRRKDLGMGSEIRNKYEQIIEQKRKNRDWTNPVFIKADYEQIKL